jgi:hypothetical protein
MTLKLFAPARRLGTIKACRYHRYSVASLIGDSPFRSFTGSRFEHSLADLVTILHWMLPWHVCFCSES